MEGLPLFIPIGIVLVAVLAWLATRSSSDTAPTMESMVLRRLVLAVVFVVAVGVAAFVLFFQQPEAPTIPYSGSAGSFLGYVKEGRVDRVVQAGPKLTITLQDGTTVVSQVPSEFATNVLADIQEVCAEPDAHCVPGKPELIAVEPSQTGQLLTLVLTALLPVILIGATFFYLLRQGRAAGGYGGSKPTTRARLQELEDLRTKGLITEGEYAAKRGKILDEL